MSESTTAAPILVIGAGGFGREVHDVIIAINASQPRPTWDFAGFIDDGHPDLELLSQRGASYLGTSAELLAMTGVLYVVGIGDPVARRRLAEVADSAGLVAATLVHPTATIGLGVEIGAGTIVCSHVSITTNIRIGRHVHLDQNVAIGHDATLRDFTRVNPGATIAGCVTLEEDATVGASSTVIQGLTIGRGTVVGAGAAVVRDLPAGVVAVGVPARPLREPGGCRGV